MDKLSALQKFLLRSLIDSGVDLDSITAFCDKYDDQERKSSTTAREHLCLSNEKQIVETRTSNYQAHSTTVDDKGLLQNDEETMSNSPIIPVSSGTRREDECTDINSTSNVTATMLSHDGVTSTSDCFQTEDSNLLDDCDGDTMVQKLARLDPWESSNLIKSFMNQHNIPQKEAVDRTGLNQSHLSQHLNKGTPMKEHKRMILYRWFVRVRQEVAKQYRVGMKRSRVQTELAFSEEIETCRKQGRNRFKWGKASLAILNDAFKVQPNPLKETRCALAVRCNQAELKSRGLPEDRYGALAANFVTEMRVYNWFANRRKEDSFRNRVQRSQEEVKAPRLCSEDSEDLLVRATDSQLEVEEESAKETKNGENPECCLLSCEDDEVQLRSDSYPKGIKTNDEVVLDRCNEKGMLNRFSLLPQLTPEILESSITSKSPLNGDTMAKTDAEKSNSTSASNQQLIISDFSKTTPVSIQPVTAAKLAQLPDTLVKVEESQTGTKLGEHTQPLYVLSPVKPHSVLQMPKPTVNETQNTFWPRIQQTSPYLHFTHIPIPVGHEFGIAYPNFPMPLNPFYYSPFGPAQGLYSKEGAMANIQSISPLQNPATVLPFTAVSRLPVPDLIPVTMDNLKQASEPEPQPTPARTNPNFSSQKAVLGIFHPLKPLQNMSSLNIFETESKVDFSQCDERHALNTSKSLPLSQEIITKSATTTKPFVTSACGSFQDASPLESLNKIVVESDCTDRCRNTVTATKGSTIKCSESPGNEIEKLRKTVESI